MIPPAKKAIQSPRGRGAHGRRNVFGIAASEVPFLKLAMLPVKQCYMVDLSRCDMLLLETFSPGHRYCFLKKRDFNSSKQKEFMGFFLFFLKVFKLVYQVSEPMK